MTIKQTGFSELASPVCHLTFILFPFNLFYLKIPERIPHECIKAWIIKWLWDKKKRKKEKETNTPFILHMKMSLLIKRFHPF